MAVLPIVKNPDPVLRKKAKPVQKISAAVRRLLSDMAETMYDAPGVGLAAPQVGVSKRIIVADCNDGRGLVELINPEIVQTEGITEDTEGCLSIPGIVGDVVRGAKLQVTGLNRHGRRIWIDADALLARCLQHEIDHLDGILFIDKATRIRDAAADTDDTDDTDGADDAGDAGANIAPEPPVTAPQSDRGESGA